MISALVQKDVRLYFRNQFFALITALGLVVYIAIYHLMPSQLEQTLTVGLYLADGDTSPLATMLDQLFEAERFDSEEALVAAVERSEVPMGWALSSEVLASIASGQPTEIDLYMAPNTPAELQAAYTDVLSVALNDMSNPEGSQLMQIGGASEVIGPDRLAEPVPIRDRLLPALLLLILLTEAMGIATLIAEERTQGTAQAVLVTPLTPRQFFAAKTIMGLALAFLQLLILVAVSGKLGSAPLITMATLLAGSLLATALAFLVAAVASDLMSVLAWSVLGLVILVLPALTLLFPTLATRWMTYVPSFYFVDTLYLALNFGAGWSAVGTNLLILTMTGVVALVAGMTLLARRLQ